MGARGGDVDTVAIAACQPTGALSCLELPGVLVVSRRCSGESQVGHGRILRAAPAARVSPVSSHRRQEVEAAPVLGLQEVPAVLADAPAVQLQRGLVAERLERLGPDSVRGGAVSCLAELLQGQDPARREPVDVGAPDPGHEHDVVVVLEPPVALAPPDANRAVVARPRVRLRRLVERREESLPHPPVVGGVLGHAEALPLPDRRSA